MSELLTISGDPHVKTNNLEKINQLFDLFEELGNDVLILGDLFDTKEVIRGKALNLVRARIKRSKLRYIILVGNHDYFNLECLDHSLQSLKDLPNVIIVDEPLQIGIDVMAIPYIHDRDKFRETVKSFKKGSTVFMHQGFSGFDYGNGYIAEGESELGEIAHLGNVISGHFHKYQQSGNLTYLGTPFSHSFGESNQEKFIGIYNTKTKALELVESPFPMHLTIECEATDDLEAWSLPRQHHLRFIVKGTQQELLSYNKEYLKSLSDVEVKIIEKPTDEFINGAVIEETADNLAQFSTWANDIRKLSPEITALGIQILGAVSAK